MCRLKISGRAGFCGKIANDELGALYAEHMKQSRYIYLEGYLFESECAARTMLRPVGIARKNGVKVALTASDAGCVSRHRDLLVQLIKNDVDLLVANAREAQILSDVDNNKAALRVLSG